MPSFTSRIAIIGINPYVIPPAAVLKTIFKQAGKSAVPIPVRGTLGNFPFQQTLVKYQGTWRLYLNGPMRKGADGTRELVVGDRVRVTISFDATPRTFPMPPAFKRALALPANRAARAKFLAFAPYLQKDLNRYLGHIKTKETLERNIGIIITFLKGKKPKSLGALLRVNK